MFHIVIVAVCLFLGAYTPSIGEISISILRFNVSIDAYAFLATLIALSFLYHLVMTLISWVSRLSKWNSVAKERMIIASLCEAILADEDAQAPSIQLNKLPIPSNLELLKTALIIRKDSDKLETIAETGAPGVDIYVMRHRLRKLLKQGNVNKCVQVACETIDKYWKYLPIIQNEILMIAELARESAIDFRFDPRKSKYNLSPAFLEQYCVSLALIDFRLTPNDDAKLKILEKAVNDFPGNVQIISNLLDVILEHPHDNSEKKMIGIITKAFSLRPDRSLAYYLIKTNRKDILEVAQKITSGIPDTNIEKIWFMLIIATKLNLVNKVKEMIRCYLKDGNQAHDLASFYIQNHQILSSDSEIVETIRRIDHANQNR